MPESARRQRDLGLTRCHLALAEIYLIKIRGGAIFEAKRFLDRAESLARQLEEPERLEVLAIHRRLYARWIGPRLPSGVTQESAIREAIAFAEDLARRDPSGAGHIDLIAGCYSELGNILSNGSEDAREAAVPAYREALGWLDRRAALQDEPAEAIHRRATIERNLARALRLLRRNDEARHGYERAGAVFERLVQEFPAVPLYHSELGEVIQGAALTGRGIVPPEETLRLLDRSLEQARIAYRMDPLNSTFKLKLLNKHASRIEDDLAAGRHADAARALDEFQPLAFRTYDFIFAAQAFLDCERLVAMQDGLAPSERSETARRYHTRARDALRGVANDPGPLRDLRRLIADDGSDDRFRGSKPLRNLLDEIIPPGALTTR